MHEKPILHTDFVIFRGADVIGRKKPSRHPQAKYQHTFLKWQWKGEKKVSWNSDIREFRRYQEDY